MKRSLRMKQRSLDRILSINLSASFPSLSKKMFALRSMYAVSIGHFIYEKQLYTRGFYNMFYLEKQRIYEALLYNIRINI